MICGGPTLSSKLEIASRLPIRRGLSASEAALYVGLGATKFRELVVEGRMPKPRLIDGRRVWDIDDLDAAFKSLPTEEGDGAEKPNTWSDLE